MKLGFIGAGRVAQGLGTALQGAGYDIHAIASRSPGAATSLAASLGCAVVTAQDVADRCDLVFLTVPDDSIEDVAKSIQWRAGAAVVHCSGATEVSALDAAARAGARTAGFHPLQSFSQGGTDLSGCTITVEARSPLFETLEAMVGALECRLNRLPPGKRALYHASAGYGAGFIHVLLAEIADIWGEWGASEADMIAAILPMAHTTLGAIERDGIAQSMPGPVSRGDAGSVRAHLAAMRDRPDTHRFYRAHALRSVGLALQAGRIDTDTARTLSAILAPDATPDAENPAVR